MCMASGDEPQPPSDQRSHHSREPRSHAAASTCPLKRQQQRNGTVRRAVRRHLPARRERDCKCRRHISTITAETTSQPWKRETKRENTCRSAWDHSKKTNVHRGLTSFVLLPPPYFIPPSGFSFPYTSGDVEGGSSVFCNVFLLT